MLKKELSTLANLHSGLVYVKVIGKLFINFIQNINNNKNYCNITLIIIIIMYGKHVVV